MKLKDFWQKDYADYAAYANIRTIASYVDGQKIVTRKLLYAADKFNLNDSMKLSSFVAKMTDSTQYLHGNVSAEGAAVNMAQDFVGTNNISLLYPDGSFGNRTVQEPAPSRYIYTRKQKIFDKIFIKDDFTQLPEQQFEGEIIEPKYYMPIIPMIFVNGNSGIGNGFSQKILNRNPKDLISTIKNKLNNKKYIVPSPWFKDFKGKVVKDEGNGWKIYGVFERTNKVNLKITELPLGYDLDGYIAVLDQLEEKKTIYKYIDKSENNDFIFEIQTSVDFLKLDDETIYKTLKLVTKISEIYTCTDENNYIREFKTPEEVFEAYYKIRYDHYQKRKEYIIYKLNKDLQLYKNRGKFIAAIIKGDVVINNKAKDDIENQLAIKEFDKFDNSYDYLLNMKLWDLTKENLTKLMEKIKELEAKYKEAKEKTIEQMWLEDLNELKF